jgi:hypothetical protein
MLHALVDAGRSLDRFAEGRPTPMGLAIRAPKPE